MSTLYESTVSPPNDDSVPSLQVTCIDSLITSADEAMIIEFLHAFKEICLPSSMFDIVVEKLISSGSLTRDIVHELAHVDIDTLSFTGLKLNDAQDDMFDGLFATGSCVKRLIMDEVVLEPCFFKMFAAATYTEIPSYKSNLMHLHVNNCEGLTDQYVLFFTQSFHHLESLLISSCPLLSPDAIIYITHAIFSPSLKALDISFNAASSAAMSYLTNLASIEKLDISHMTCQESFRFTPPAATLKVLHMSSLYYLSDEDIRHILCGGLIPNNLVMKSLTELSLTESAISSKCLLSLIEECCPLSHSPYLLQKLDLSWTNENLTNSDLAQLVSNCKHLTELKLQSTDAGESTFRAIASTCHNLHVLHFSRCVPDMLPLQCLSSLKHLKSLNLAWAIFTPEELDLWVQSSQQSESTMKEVSFLVYF